MKNRLSLLALLLVLVMALTMLVACGGETETSTPEQSTTSTTDTSTTDTSVADGDTLVIPEDFSWDKEEFVILSGQTTFSRYYGVYNEFGMSSDELEQSVINDAVINRNLAVEQLLDIKIVEKAVDDDDRMTTGNMYTTVVQQIDSGAADFDMIAPSLYQAAALAVNDYLYNLHEIKDNQLDKDWWDNFFVDEVTMNDRLYFVTGDIGFYSKGAITAVYFNKETAQSLELGDVYALAREKKFTYDVMYSWMKLILEDINSDNVFNYKDKFGMGGQHDLTWALFYGAGQYIAQKDEDQNPYLTIGTERALTVAEKLSQIVMDDSFVNANDYWNDAPDGKPTNLLVQAFVEGRSLMFAETLGQVEWLRDMDFDFGILPIPLFDENQERYYSLLNCWGSNAFGIPTSLYDDEAEGVMVIMNALGAKGKEFVTPAYIETTLKGQRLRDDDSEEMLDIIFENIGCDIGHMYNFGRLGFDALHKLAEGQNMATLIDSLKSKAQSEIDDFITNFND
ncbi:MAG: hypothetical protein IJN75_04930 [Clostridia bacterium]|nr:hypothetical protein [Clostridia bacterium]